VRHSHGARLDAADKTWHLTSPAPYDPPLTYGGWSQAKALGLRIASQLHARDQERQTTASTTNGGEQNGSSLGHGPQATTIRPANRTQTQKRKQKIVIHTSPYLRCVQTSIAIAAGISQFNPSPTDRHSQTKPNGLSSRVYSAENPSLKSSRRPPQHTGPEKVLLRIDAFLGEWLTPDYYEDITPPPNSTMMVASAMADLLRRGEYTELQAPDGNRGYFPGGWVKGNAAAPKSNGSAEKPEDGPLSSLGALAQISPFRERSSSQGNFGARPGLKGTPLTTAHLVPNNVYDPPVPQYAVSPIDPIPRGYVAHARDACVDVDFGWDSMRAPQEWGDGGEYGDEWSTMHKRFRKGLAAMLSWYKNHDCAEHNVHGTTQPKIDSTEDEDVVLILVTHGAGCNALLGAISNQPVLMDVGMASLSMAVRKDVGPTNSSSSFSGHSRKSSLDTGIQDEYELKITASVDHLRPGVDPTKLLQQVNSSMKGGPSLESRRRFGTSAENRTGSIDSPIMPGEPLRGLNSSLGSIRRPQPSSQLSSNTVSNSSTSSSITGLWSRNPIQSEIVNEAVTSPGSDMVLNFGYMKPSASSSTVETKQAREGRPPLPAPVQRTLSQHGLWGSPVMEGPNEREAGQKRRWTMSERD